MEKISGTCPWRMKIEEHNGKITVLRAVTCVKDAEIPAEINGKPVVEIAGHALAAGDFEENGSCIEISFGNPNGEWNNRAIETLNLPKGIKSIGRYAFLNCTALETLKIFDEIEMIGAGAFMNCRGFRRLILERNHGEQGPALAETVSLFSKEIEVEILENEKITAKLIFPEYYELRLENEPTHFFSYTIEGAGYPYHHMFRQKKMSFQDYDALWERYISSDYEEQCALKLAWNRIRYPYELSSAAKSLYAEFVNNRFEKAGTEIIKENDREGLGILLGCTDVTREKLSHLLGKAVETGGRTEIRAMILEETHRRFSSGRNRSFEL